MSVNAFAGGGQWTVVAWNNLGMHCMDDDYSVFSILPPFNTLNAQVMDAAGKLVKSPDTNVITVTYEAVADPDGSINTTSTNKTSFYQYAQALYGANLAVNQGLAGCSMPGPSNTPQKMTWVPAMNWFEAAGIPICPTDDRGRKNSYPMMRVSVRSNNVTLATADVVVPVSDEMDCRACHSSGKGPEAKPAAGWVYDSVDKRDFRLNILRLHDEHQMTNAYYAPALAQAGYSANGLYDTVTQMGKPILCASCHASEALGTAGATGVPPLTRAMHSKHATVTNPTDGLKMNSELSRNACYMCHPGSATRCLRGAMGNAVLPSNGTMEMQCQNCHGTLSQVGDANRTGWLDEPNCQACHTGDTTTNSGQIRYTSVFIGALPAHITATQPVAGGPVTVTYAKSGSLLGAAAQVYIHIGYNTWNGVITPDPAMTNNGTYWSYVYQPPVGATVVNFVFNNGAGVWDNNNALDYSLQIGSYPAMRVPVNQRFATTVNTPAAGKSLFRFSQGHGGLSCSACHGSTHAEYPTAFRNDNLYSFNKQGHKGKLADCTVCHPSMPANSLAGPHAVHPIGSSTWVNNHATLARSLPNYAACRVCHGQDDRGTPLSRAQADRSLSTKFGAFVLKRGMEVSCYYCHDGPGSSNPSSHIGPTVASGQLNVPVNAPTSVTLTASGTSPVLRIIEQPIHGTVGISNKVATYFPEKDYQGPDFFTYIASDSGSYIDSKPATWSVMVGNQDHMLEYALGLDPKMGNSLQPAFTNLSGTRYMTLDVPRSPMLPPDATVSFWVSGDLATWSAATLISTNSSQIKVRDNVDASTAPARFIRAKVTRQTPTP